MEAGRAAANFVEWQDAPVLLGRVITRQRKETDSPQAAALGRADALWRGDVSSAVVPFSEWAGWPHRDGLFPDVDPGAASQTLFKIYFPKYFTGSGRRAAEKCIYAVKVYAVVVHRE